jgi:glycosyltransferase involved in cell wall biosynthesis
LRDLVFISAGLELDGGGRAVAGRLLAAASAAFAAERGLGWSLLSLAGLDGFDGDPRARGFGGRQRALALAAWRRQLGGRRPAFLYDLLGPARLQAWLPAPLAAPYLVTIYGIEVWRPLTGARARALRRAAIRLATSVHTRAEAQRVQGEVGAIEVLPLCLEDRPPAGTRDDALLARAGSGFLLIVGRMVTSERYKGHDVLLEALGRLKAKRPRLDQVAGSVQPCPNEPAGDFQPYPSELPGDPRQDEPARDLRPRLEAAGNIQPRLNESPGDFQPRLVIAGSGDDQPRLQARARELGLGEDRVLFTGFVSEATLAELYRRCAVFVMPSLGEGFGLVYLEAMRAARPCVAARDTAAGEIVVDGETGLLVDPRSAEELAAALESLLRQPERACALGEAGLRRYQQVYTPERFRARLWPYLDRLAEAAS